MQKRRFKWLAAACSLLLVASTGAAAASEIWNNIPVAGAYEVAFENDAQLQEEYALGSSLTIPKGLIEGVPASSYTVQFPSGKVVNDSMIDLVELGAYTITWYANVNGQKFSASKTFKVTQGAYSVSGGITLEEKTSLEKHAGKSGVKLTFEPESTFYYNKAVDLTAEGPFAQVYPFFGMKDLMGNLEKYARPALTITDEKVLKSEKSRIAQEFEYEDEARNYLITLTDCYDSSNTVTIDLEWMEGKLRWNFSANPAGQRAHGLRGPLSEEKISQTSLNIDGTYYRVDMAPSEGHINANIVEAHKVTDGVGKGEICGGFDLRYDVETNGVYITYTKAAVSVKYKDDTKKEVVVKKSYTREEKMIADLDNTTIYPNNTFKGFTTGEVYVSFTAKTFTGNKAHMEIASLGGLTGNEMVAFEEDTVKPTIQVDERMRTMNKIALGEQITIPDATALDLNLPYGTIADVAVYHLYDPNKTNVREPLTADNKFKPTKLGAYTVVYTATDRNGNVGMATVPLQCLTGELNKAVSMTADATAVCEAGDYFTIPAPSLKGLYKDSSAVKVSVTNADGKALPVESGQVFLPGVMDYTVTYTYETPFKTYTVETVVSATASANVVLEKPILPEYFIKGATYTLDDAIAYTYTAKEPIANEANVSIIAIQENGTQTEIPTTIKAVEIPACKSMKLKYAYGGIEEYSEEIQVLDVGFDGEISMIDYFHSEEEGVFEKIPSKSAMKYLTNGTATSGTLKYINVLSLAKFKLDYTLDSKYQETALSPIENYVAPGAVVLRFTDYYNRNNQVEIRLTLNGEKAKVELDGKVMGTTTGNYMDVKTMISCQEDGFLVGGLKCVWENNFTSDKVLFEIELELKGKTSMRISAVSGKNFALGRETKAVPDISVSQADLNIGYHNVGDVITIVRPTISDILAPYTESGLSLIVFAPDGSYVTSLDGVRLDGTCPTDREYQIELKQEGPYSVQYHYKNQNNLKNQLIGGPTVLNPNAPVLLVEGKTEGQQDKASLGDTIATAPYTVSDDDTTGNELKNWCSVIYPSGVLKLLKSGASFQATEKGTYTVMYCAYDSIGNTSTFVYTIKVS